MVLPVHLEVNTKGMDFAVQVTANNISVVVEIAEVLVLQVVSTKAMDSANQMITNNSFLVVDLAEHLALLELNTKGMVSAEATSAKSNRQSYRQRSDHFFPA